MANLLSWYSAAFFFLPGFKSELEPYLTAISPPTRLTPHFLSLSTSLTRRSCGLIAHLFLPSLPVGEMGDPSTTRQASPVLPPSSITPKFLPASLLSPAALLLFLTRLPPLSALGWGGTKQIHTHFLSPNMGKRSFRDVQRVMGRKCEKKNSLKEEKKCYEWKAEQWCIWQAWTGLEEDKTTTTSNKYAIKILGKRLSVLWLLCIVFGQFSVHVWTKSIRIGVWLDAGWTPPCWGIPGTWEKALGKTWDTLEGKCKEPLYYKRKV